MTPNNPTVPTIQELKDAIEGWLSMMLAGHPCGVRVEIADFLEDYAERVRNDEINPWPSTQERR
jgi:hypothetical protein